MTQLDDRLLVRARTAVFVLFASFGAILATWAVHLPTLQRAAGLSTSMLGTVLLIVGVGALGGMQLSVQLSKRFGTGGVAAAASAVLAATVVVPLSMTASSAVLVGAFVFGVATGTADVAMNASAVRVERSYGRPILAAFHAMFSVGTVIGSGLGALGYAVGMPMPAAAAATVTACAVASGCAGLMLRGWTDAPVSSSSDHTKDGSRSAGGLRRVLILSAVSFLLLLSEGSAMDWASVHAQHHFRVAPALGTLAFGAFVTAMTVSRFTVDRIAHRLGPVAVLRYGSLMAAAGIATVIAAPNLGIAVIGWVLFGLGLAGGLPQVFTAAGNLASPCALARVVGAGYLAMLAGPAVIGWLGEATSLNTAFAIPLCAVAVCALGASVVVPRR